MIPTAPLSDAAVGTSALVLVALAIMVLFVLVSVTAGGLMIHHSWTHMKRVRLRRRGDIATTMLAQAVGDSEALHRAVSSSVRRVGGRATAAALRQFRIRIKGSLAAELSEHLEHVGEVDHLGRLGRARRAWLRRAAARGLGECGGPRARGYLATLAKDRNPEVRRTARNALLACADKNAVHLAIESYFSDMATHRGWKAAFYARLAAVAPEEIRALFAKRRLSGVDEKLALEALGDVRDNAAAPLAAERLDVADAELRATAIRVVGKLRCEEHRQRVLGHLSDAQWFVRAAAARALETLGADPPVDEALRSALGDREWWVRANAARALARRGEAGLGHLMATLEGADHYARDAAMAALTSAGALARVVARLRQIAVSHPEDEALAGILARMESARA